MVPDPSHNNFPCCFERPNCTLTLGLLSLGYWFLLFFFRFVLLFMCALFDKSWEWVRVSWNEPRIFFSHTYNKNEEDCRMPIRASWVEPNVFEELGLSKRCKNYQFHVEVKPRQVCEEVLGCGIRSCIQMDMQSPVWKLWRNHKSSAQRKSENALYYDAREQQWHKKANISDDW